MRQVFKISEARTKLFDLVDRVTSTEESIILIEHRDKAERAALVSEQHLRYLDATIAELRKQGTRPFRLAGSMKLLVSEDEIEAGIERTFAWLMRYRLLRSEYATTTASSVGWIYTAMIHLMVRRLTV